MTIEQRAAWTSRVLILASAASVLAVSVGTSALAGRSGDRVDLPQPPPEQRLLEGGVDEDFTCPTDDDFRPTLRAGPRAEAQRHGAPRYEYVAIADRAQLRLGNTDGTLASVSEFRWAGGRWELVRATRCSSEVVTIHSEGEWTLGRHDKEPWPAETMLDPAFVDGEPVLLDDRSFYTAAGLTSHRSIYAAPCALGLCWAAGSPASMIGTSTPARADQRPVDLRAIFLPRDELVGKSSPYGLWVLYGDGSVTGLDVRLREGAVIPADAFRVSGWDRTLYVVLAPFNEVSQVSVHTSTRAVSYSPEELPGFDPSYPAPP